MYGIEKGGGVWAQGKLLENITQQYIDYFKLKSPEKQQEQEELSDSPVPAKSRK